MDTWIGLTGKLGSDQAQSRATVPTIAAKETTKQTTRRTRKSRRPRSLDLALCRRMAKPPLIFVLTPLISRPGSCIPQRLRGDRGDVLRLLGAAFACRWQDRTFLLCSSNRNRAPSHKFLLFLRSKPRWDDGGPLRDDACATDSIFLHCVSCVRSRRWRAAKASAPPP